MSNNNIMLSEAIIIKHLDGEVLCLDCPQNVLDVKINFIENARLLIQTNPIALVFLFPDGPGKKKTLIAKSISEFDIPAVAFIIDKTNKTIVIDKNKGIEELELSKVNSTWLKQKLNTSKGLSSKVSEKNLDKGEVFKGWTTPWSILTNPKVEDAHLIAAHAEDLSRKIHDQNIPPESWEAISTAALMLLPEVVNDKKNSGFLITAIVKSVVFLSETARQQASIKLLDIALLEKTPIEISESLSGIALAVLPSLKEESVAKILYSLQPKLVRARRFPPSFAQFISMANSKLMKRTL